MYDSTDGRRPPPFAAPSDIAAYRWHPTLDRAQRIGGYNRRGAYGDRRAQLRRIVLNGDSGAFEAIRTDPRRRTVIADEIAVSIELRPAADTHVIFAAEADPRYSESP